MKKSPSIKLYHIGEILFSELLNTAWTNKRVFESYLVEDKLLKKVTMTIQEFLKYSLGTIGNELKSEVETPLLHEKYLFDPQHKIDCAVTIQDPKCVFPIEVKLASTTYSPDRFFEQVSKGKPTLVLPMPPDKRQGRYTGKVPSMFEYIDGLKTVVKNENYSVTRHWGLVTRYSQIKNILNEPVPFDGLKFIISFDDFAKIYAPEFESIFNNLLPVQGKYLEYFLRQN